MKTIKSYIPNTITCGNLISGCIATYLAFLGQPQWALTMIVVGAVFDFFDGMSARLLGVQSEIGLELDSLADDITFGVAPSAIVFTFLQGLCPQPSTLWLLPFAAFLMAAFSALRLAKFNLDERQTTSFIGLPTPANALFWGALIAGWGHQLAVLPHAEWLVMGVVLLSCWLLVSELPMFSLKVKHLTWRGNRTRLLFVAVCVPLLLLLGTKGLAVCIAWYVLLSVIVAVGNRRGDTPSTSLSDNQ